MEIDDDEYEELDHIFEANSKLTHYKHYPKIKADKKINRVRRKKYVVKTINLTLVTEDGRKNSPKQHKNKYILTLEALELWGLFMFEVAEVIISVRRKIF